MTNSRLRTLLVGRGFGIALAVGILTGCGMQSTPPPATTVSAEPTPSLTAPALATPTTPEGILQTRLAALFDSSDFSNAYWGVRVERLNGDMLYDRNGVKEFTPASNMKIYTTAACLDLLGPDYRYKTRLEAVGSLQDGKLEGDLVIVGSGDPSFGSWHLPDGSDSRTVLGQWASKVKEAGIKEVSGDVIGDGRFFTDEYYSPTWELGDLPYWYGTGSSGLAIEENCFRFTVAPGAAPGEPGRITLLPDTKYITVVNETKTVGAGMATTADIVHRDPESNTVTFGGTIALDKAPSQQRGSVWDGAHYAAVLFRETLERRGIRVDGGAENIRSLKDPSRIDLVPAAEHKVLATYASPPMSEILAILLKPSHNFYADQLLRTLGRVRKGTGDFATGAAVVRQWLAAIGAPQADTVKQADGSGLARRDIVQPRQTCALLRHMYSSPRLRKAYYDALPIAGVDGTLRNRMTQVPTRGNVHAKTGFITRVRSLSGYVTDADGEMLVFSMMANQFTVPVRRANQIQDAACTLLAQYSEKKPAGTSPGTR